MTFIEILQFKYPDQMKNGQIIVKDNNDGNGPYIDKWQMGSIPKPTNAEVLAWATDTTVLTNQAIWNRLNQPDGYKSIYDQLGMIYDDLKNNTQTWTEHNRTVKNTYPKPGQTTNSTTITPIVVTKRNSPSAAFKEILIAKSSANQAISGTNKVNLIFGTKTSDPNNAFSNNTYTAVTGGLYEIVAFARVTNYAILSIANNYTWTLSLTQAGSSSISQDIGSYTHAQLGASPGSLQGTHMVYLAAGDTLTIQISKTDATSLNVTFAYVDIKKISEA